MSSTSKPISKVLRRPVTRSATRKQEKRKHDAETLRRVLEMAKQARTQVVALCEQHWRRLEAKHERETLSKLWGQPNGIQKPRTQARPIIRLHLKRRPNQPQIKQEEQQWQ
ncbi:hypothetical protein MBLNU459_g6789t1 [Dothideomycetes sp. NU459]